MGATPDVLVVGAGPAGSAAAVAAAEHGLRVTVWDRARFPRDKTCGDGLTAGALRHLERLGVDAPALDGYVRVDEVVVRSPSGRTVTFPMPGDGHHAAVVPRAALDAALLDAARHRGVEVHEGVAVEEVVADGAGVKVRATDGRTLEVPWLVAADGHYSTVRRLLRSDHGPRRGEWHAARQYFRGVDDRRLWILFEPDLLPGYAWVFPLPGGRANVGFGVLRADGRSGREHKALWHDLLDRPSLRSVLGPDAEPEGSVRAWPIPTRFDPSGLDAGRCLFVGDAAGVVDPMTGEGVAQALETGILAARAVAAGGAPDSVGTRYRAAVSHDLGTDLWFARSLQRLLRAPGGARAAVRVAGLSPWTRGNFARWLFEDYPRGILLTPRRWHPGMLSGPGAFRGVAARASVR